MNRELWFYWLCDLFPTSAGVVYNPMIYPSDVNPELANNEIILEDADK